MNDQKKGPIRILLAEDNPADAYLIREALNGRSLEFELDVVEDGEAALRFMESRDAEVNAPCVDLLMVDLNLPRKSGLEILQRVKLSPKCGGIKVIVLSSSDSPADRAEAARLHADQYFCKPASLQDFFKIGDIVIELMGR
jgi:CheY-like chemotaxis protein